MEHRGPSRTAVVTAMLRGAHYRLDDSPPIFADRFARPFAPGRRLLVGVLGWADGGVDLSGRHGRDLVWPKDEGSTA